MSRGIREQEHMSQDELKKMRRMSYIKMVAMVGIVAAVIAFGSIAWFTMNREVEGSGVQMTSSNLPFEIATKGSTIRNQEVINSQKIEYETGNSSGSYYIADSLLLRFDPVDDPATTDVDEALDPPDIAPGSSGALNLYVVPKSNESFDVNISLNVIAFAEFEKKNGNSTVYKKNEQGENLLDDNGNPIPDTVIAEITTVSEFAAVAADAGNTEIAAEAADYVKAADYLRGHILFFGTQNEASTPDYYFSDPLYYIAVDDNPAQPSRTKIKNIPENMKDQMIPVPIYWMWTNTFGQVALPDNVSGKRNGLPILADADSAGKAAIKAYLKENIPDIFANNSSSTSGYIDTIATHVDSVDDFNGNYFSNLSDGYNQADYAIGTKISYFMIEVSVGLKE